LRRWIFGLAERLHMTVAGMLEEMSSSELTDWLAYDRWKAQPATEEPLSQEALADKIRRVFGKRR